MKNKIIRRVLILFCLINVVQLSAQQADKAEVFAVVEQLFEAMNKSDTALLKDVFSENPSLYTVLSKEKGQGMLKLGDLDGFVKSVGKAAKGSLNEPIWNQKVQIDGDLAQVWLDYAFYFNGNFSHCGVDAFHLVRQDNQWKIFHLVDTRRRNDCQIPEEIQKQFE